LVFSSDFRKMAPKPPVIRASGARCNITRPTPKLWRGRSLVSCKEARVQKAAVPDTSPAVGAAGSDRLRGLVLVRIASAVRGLAKAEIASDLAALANPGLQPAQWQAHIERQIEALAGAGLIAAGPPRIEARPAGMALAARFLGVKGAFPRVWSDVRDVRLVARALGLQRQPAKRLAALATQDGLRVAIVTSAHRLEIKGVATPARLREALAATALRRAFGNKSSAGLAGKLGLSSKAGRLLAAQLSKEPRDFGTDTRLVAALAAEHVGARSAELGALRQALLRQYFGGAAVKPAQAMRPSVKRTALKREPVAPPALERPRAPSAPPVSVRPVQGPPDLGGFALEVRRHAASKAHGWSGDRKAYISHVWRDIRDQRPDWGLSEIEFKCMLAEAHRSGQLALANADLKDQSNIKDVQDSAVVYRNAVFHFIRVDA
jgi:hypothetical protein